MPTTGNPGKTPIIFLLLLIVFAAGCEGFFVDPALTSMTVTPTTPSIVQGGSVQMAATGSYEDGTRSTLTSSATWSSSATDVATVSKTGLVTGISPGTSSISATSGSVSGSTNVTVSPSGLASIQVTPTTASISSGQTQAFHATGILQNGQREDITTAVTWESSRQQVATIDATGLATAKTVNLMSTTHITATSGTVVSNTALLTVTP